MADSNISKVQLPSGSVFNIIDTTSGYVTIADVPAISVNTVTKTLVITTSVENADTEEY